MRKMTKLEAGEQLEAKPEYFDSSRTSELGHHVLMVRVAILDLGDGGLINLVSNRLPRDRVIIRDHQRKFEIFISEEEVSRLAIVDRAKVLINDLSADFEL